MEQESVKIMIYEIDEFDLKCCPFCGSDDVHLLGSYGEDDIDFFNQECNDNVFHVMCNNCRADTNYFDTEDAAANAWNRRECNISNSETQLKSCPFCGSDDVHLLGDHEDGVFHVMCKNCKAESDYFDDVEDAAIAAWNRRSEA